MHHKLPRPLHAPDASRCRVLVQLLGLRYQQITEFDGRERVVLGDILNDAPAIGKGSGLPNRQT